MQPNKKILFLCTGNSCRSQMAEGMLRRLAGNRCEVFSAGINPTKVNPYAIEAMREIGIDISTHSSKSADEFKDARFDFVITVCDNARESCPIFPGSKMLHWNLEDPADAKGNHDEIMTEFRKTRDLIEKEVHNFIAKNL